MLKFLLSKKKTINLVIEDYAIRMVDHSGGDLTNMKECKEKAIPNGLLEHGRITDEMEFFGFLKETVQEWGIKRRDVQFYVPDSLVIMKKVQFPAELKDDEINGHFIMELGRTLYLPFENPTFDVFPLPNQSREKSHSEREGLLFAVPEEELMKYTELFDDAGLQPISADIRSLGIYRFYHYLWNPNETDAYLFFECNLNSIQISIFSNHQPEFLRYLDLDIELSDWVSHENGEASLSWTFEGDETRFLGLIDDQLLELERIMNFYQYSIHKGEKAVQQIILLGDFPQLSLINERMEARIHAPITILDAYLSPNDQTKMGRAFIPALGLALKRGKMK